MNGSELLIRVSLFRSISGGAEAHTGSQCGWVYSSSYVRHIHHPIYTTY